jgi:hypothetical protein
MDEISAMPRVSIPRPVTAASFGWVEMPRIRLGSGPRDGGFLAPVVPLLTPRAWAILPEPNR